MPARGNHAKIKSVEIVDDFTVRFKTDGPYPLFVERLSALVISSEKVMREKGHEWMQEHPIGTGPYKVVKWDRKQEHLLVRNDDYWGPKPAYKYVRIRIIPEQATQIAELLSGGVDVVDGHPAGSDGRDRQVGPGARRGDAHSPHRDAPARSGRPRRPQPVHRPSRPSSGQPRHRHGRHHQARGLNGLGDRTATAVNPMAFGWDPNLKPYKQDVAAAKKLLADAGFPNGVDIVFNQGPPVVEPGLRQTDEAIAADLTKAGFRVKQNYIGESAVQVARMKEGKLGPMFDFSWGYYSIFDADAVLYDIFKCGEPSRLLTAIPPWTT